MPSSDILLLADLLVAELLAEFPTFDIARKYRMDYDLDTLTTKKIRIFPISYTEVEPVDRSGSLYDVTLRLTYVEKYTGKGDPPDSWMDERVDWVEENLFNRFAPVQKPFRLGEYWSQTSSVESVYDYEMLNEDTAFGSDLLITFRRVK